MAAIVASDVTYTHINSVITGPGRIRRRVKLSFPVTDGSTYPAAGIPLTAAGLGFRQITGLKVMGRTTVAGSLNPLYEWNGSDSAPTLLAFEQTGVAEPLAEMNALPTFTPALSQVVFVESEGF